MVKKIKVSVTDEKYIGDEPVLTEKSTPGDVIKAYNWYNYVCDTNDAVDYVAEYLRIFKKANKDIIKKVYQIDPFTLRTIGWNCRILTVGGYLPDGIINESIKKLDALIKLVKNDDRDPIIEPPKNVVSIQDRIKDRTVDLIGALEIEIDKFCEDTSYTFDVVQWLREQAVKPMIAKKISEYYMPLYGELFDAVKGEDPNLQEYYDRWKKSDLKKFAEFVKNIINAAETNALATKVTRAPRKKKQKPAALVVRNLKYKEKDDETNITSIVPTSIVGADQLWTYNTKSRTLSCYNSLGPIGLGVKGTTITGFDEKTSISKKLRKPEIILPRLLEGGKLILRKLMDEINTKSKEATGRINTDTILLRAIK